MHGVIDRREINAKKKTPKKPNVYAGPALDV
jgi:hypothetical protein